VLVSTGGLGELQVDFGEYGWFPRRLPSETAARFAASSDED
jgi:methylated-DNA-protein-cysteine methyltransferase related protein